MNTLRVAGRLLAILALTGLVGCKGSGKPKVAFVSNNPAEFWSIAEAGAKKAADEEGVELIFKRPASGEAALQKNIIDSLLNQNVKAVAVSVIDPDNQTAYLDDVGEKVPLLAVDNDAPDSQKYRGYIGTNNYLAGRAVGKLVREAMKDGGRVVIFVGDQAPLNARQRRQGLIDELDRRPIRTGRGLITFESTPDGASLDGGKYVLHSKTYTDQPVGEAKARQNAVAALGDKAVQAAPAVCMVGLWAYNPPMILSALKDVEDADFRGRVRIVAFDEAEATLDGIKEGLIHATVVQQPYQFGYRSVKAMAALARGEASPLPADGRDFVPYRIITRDGGAAVEGEPAREKAADFHAELNQLLGK
jgi:ribose transport system substrate-binding protein